MDLWCCVAHWELEEFHSELSRREILKTCKNRKVKFNGLFLNAEVDRTSSGNTNLNSEERAWIDANSLFRE